MTYLPDYARCLSSV